MSITIGFHDVVENKSQAQPIGPGFTTLYTLDRRHFRDCLQAIRSRIASQKVQRLDRLQSKECDGIFLTVDDGKVSTFTIIAPELERLGWHGHFFITTEWIGHPGFLSERQIRELHERGHVIGSHSCSHPRQMWSLSPDELLREWNDSRARLSDIVGSAVSIASVPGGYYSLKVARSAAEAGYRALFTSEPTTRMSRVGDCRILGRYAVRGSTPASEVGSIAAGDRWNLCKQSFAWATTKTAKRITGRWYLPLRKMLLDVHGTFTHSHSSSSH